MDTFQLQVADIALAGDIRNVVHRGIDGPITYPERMVLEFLHGKESVNNVRSVGEVERDVEAEYSRLSRIYGRDLITQLFPGAVQQLPTHDKKLMTLEKSPRGILEEHVKNALIHAERRSREAAGEWVDPDEVDPFADQEPVSVPLLRRKGKKTSVPPAENNVRGETRTAEVDPDDVDLPDNTLPPEEEPPPAKRAAGRPKKIDADLDSKV